MGFFEISSNGELSLAQGKSLDLNNAQFNNPTGVAVDESNNLYISDSGNHVIRFIIFRSGF